MTNITDWAAFSRAEPELADVAEKRFGDFTHHVLATLRKDGSPRTSGIEVRFLDGDLWLGMMPGSLKALDLLRDPRFNLQANPGPGTGMGGGDVRIAGRALPVEDGEARARYVGEVSPPDPDAFRLFRVDITEVVRVSVENDEYMVVQTWRPGAELRTVKRT
jgi:hypothetical protein